MKKKTVKNIILFFLLISNIITIYIYNNDDIKVNAYKGECLELKINTPPVLYPGLVNNIAIKSKGIDREKLSLEIENGTFKYDSSSNYYRVSVQKIGKSKILIYKNEINGFKNVICERIAQVRAIPNPIPYVSLQDTLSKESLTNIGKIICYNSIYGRSEQTFNITFHTLVATVNNIEKRISSNSERFNEEQIELIKQLKSGQHLIIKNIKALMPDSTIRDLDPLVITIK